MKRVNTFAFYTLAKHLAPLLTIDDDATYGDVLFPLVHARLQIDSLLRNDIVSIRTARQAAGQLVLAINSAVPEDLTEAFKSDRDKSEIIGWWRINPIKEAVTKFETVFAEELAILDTYAVAQKGAYATSELISNAEVVVPSSIQVKLPQLAIYDLREAGKCLAFETPTAAAFHLLRAVESVLLKYYEHVLGTTAPARMRNWGVYIKTLRASNKADEKILSFLDHIRESYRNPISHPEAVLRIEEVLVLLGVSAAAIVQMGLELPQPTQ